MTGKGLTTTISGRKYSIWEFFLDKVATFIATGAYSGFSPFAPGTAGTLAAIPLYLLLSYLSSPFYLIVILVLLPISFWSSGRAEKIFNKKDSGFIVIDEIIGFIITLFLVPFGWTYIIAGFLLFRFFDITKIYPASAMEKMGGGVGVVMDDVVAGIYANITLQILIVLGFFNLF